MLPQFLSIIDFNQNERAEDEAAAQNRENYQRKIVEEANGVATNDATDGTDYDTRAR